MRRLRKTLLLLLAAAAIGSPAYAQSTVSAFKGVVEFGGVYRGAPPAISANATPMINVEAATLSTTHRLKAASGFRGGVAVQVWKQLGVGVTFSRSSSSVDASASATIPHPFFFGRGRQTQGSANGLSRDEQLISVQVRGVFSLSPRMIAAVFAGPVRASVKQGVITGVDYTEAYPYDSIDFRSAVTTNASASKVTLGGGADLAYFVSRRIGLGAGVAFSSGEVELPSVGGGTLKSKVGGVEANIGVRVRF